MPASENRFLALVRGERRGPLAYLMRAVLWWARLPYGIVVWLRNRGYDRHPARAIRVPVPVVCVGNLTVGGTGKTVCVEYVARFYRQELGRVVAILSRGYGSDGGPNDEALLLEENLPDVPHLQGVNRAELASTAVEELESDLLVLDDGFQHRQLHRDLDVVLMDVTRPLTDEYLFPRGLLREPFAGLKRAGVVLLTRCDQVSELQVRQQANWLTGQIAGLPVCRTRHEPIELVGPDGERAAVSELAGQSVLTVCGIGNPGSFARTVADLGAIIADSRVYPDHHPYSVEDVDELSIWASSFPPGTLVLTTQKDWVKLRVGELGGRKLRAVRVGLKFLDGEERFQEMLRGVVPDLCDDGRAC